MWEWRKWELGHVKVSFHDASESLFELLIGESIAEGVDGGVGVAEKVGKHVQVTVDAATKTLNHRQYVVRRPTDHEC